MWEKNKMQVTVEEFRNGEVVPEQHDLNDELGIKCDTVENLVMELKTHDQKTLYWGGLAIREIERFSKWEGIELKKWKAHCNKYAKYVMKYRKDSSTIQGINEVVAEIYSNSTLNSDDLKNLYVEQVMMGKYSTKQLEEKKLRGEYETTAKKIKEEMYSYGKSFEEIMNILYEMQADKDLIVLISEIMKARGFSLQGIRQVSVGLEGEGYQMPRKIVESLENIAKRLENLDSKKNPYYKKP